MESDVRQVAGISEVVSGYAGGASRLKAAEAAVAEAGAAPGQGIGTPVTGAGTKKLANACRFFRSACGPDARAPEQCGVAALTHQGAVVGRIDWSRG